MYIVRLQPVVAGKPGRCKEGILIISRNGEHPAGSSYNQHLSKVLAQDTTASNRESFVYPEGTSTIPAVIKLGQTVLVL